MSRFFITGTEPVHPRKGKAVRFFLREQDREKGIFRSHVLEKEISHYFFTPNLPYEQAFPLLLELEQQLQFRHLSFSFHRYSPLRYFLRAEGSKEDAEILPRLFLRKAKQGKNDPLGLNSPAKQLRWFYPAGMLLEAADPGAIPLPEDLWTGRHQPQFASLEELVQDSFAALDLEVQGWETGNDHIFMVTYASSRQKLLLHDLPFSEEQFADYRLIRSMEQQELGQALSTAIRADDPLWLFGHNIGYDQLQLRELTEDYFPASNEYYPVTKAVQRLRKMLTKGRFTLDTCGYQANYRNIFANSKLETVAGFAKTLSYAEIARLEEQARAENAAAFRQLVEYNIEDVERTAKVAQSFQPLVAAKTLYFRRDPDSVCYTSRVAVAKDYWQRRHFLEKKTFADSGKRRRELKNFSPEKLKERLLASKCQQGFFQDVHVIYVTPFLGACRELVQDSRLIQQIQQAEDPLTKFDLHQTLQAKLAYVIKEVIAILALGKNFPFLDKQETRWYRQAAEGLLRPPELTPLQRYLFSAFLRRHTIRKIELSAFLKNLQESLQEIQAFLQEHEAINRGQYFHALRRKPAEIRHGFYLGSGSCLSLAEGQFIANPFGEENPARFVYQGFDPQKGERSNFERRMLQELVARVFQGEPFPSIGSYLRKELEEFKAGNQPEEDYYVRQSARRYYRDLISSILEERERDPQSKVTSPAREAYQQLAKRLLRYAPQTRKEFQKLVKQCRGDFSSPFLEEMVKEMKHPYPAKLNLVYSAEFKGALVPAGFSWKRDLESYGKRVEEQFRPWLKVLAQRQMGLF